MSDLMQNTSFQLQTFLHSYLNQMKRDYVRAVNKDLSQHQWQGTLYKNVTQGVEQALSNLKSTLHREKCLPLDATSEELITDMVHQFIAESIQHNRTSCALSNFADEHNPNATYLTEVAKTCEAHLQQFIDNMKQPL